MKSLIIGLLCVFLVCEALPKRHFRRRRNGEFKTLPANDGATDFNAQVLPARGDGQHKPFPWQRNTADDSNTATADDSNKVYGKAQ